MPDPASSPSKVLRLSFQNARVVLSSPPTPEDDPNFLSLYTSPISLKYLPFKPTVLELDDIVTQRIERVADPARVDFSVHASRASSDNTSGESGENPEFLGVCMLFNIDGVNRSAEAGIMVQPAWHRRGLSAEIFLPLFDYGFRVLKMHRVVLTTASQNAPMNGWLSGVMGAQVESVMREAWREVNNGYGGSYVDANVYAVLDREWEGWMRKRLCQRIVPGSDDIPVELWTPLSKPHFNVVQYLDTGRDKVCK
jgi:RimJ/RimL family protein N-acetyltransferase